MAHRSIGGSLLRHLPALVDIYQDDHPLVVVQKSAQAGLTELAVNKALWAADTAQGNRGGVLFLMPHQNQMDDFAQSRFDRAIQDSAYLRGRLQPEPPRRKTSRSETGTSSCAARTAGARSPVSTHYRELLAPKRTLEPDSQGNWRSRWVDNNKADHYTHAELYCLMAGVLKGPRIRQLGRRDPFAESDTAKPRLRSHRSFSRLGL